MNLNESFYIQLSNALSKLTVGDPVIVVYCLGYKHQKAYKASIEKMTKTQFVIEGLRYDRRSGVSISQNNLKYILPFENGSNFLKWQLLMNQVESIKSQTIYFGADELMQLVDLLKSFGIQLRYTEKLPEIE